MRRITLMEARDEQIINYILEHSADFGIGMDVVTAGLRDEEYTLSMNRGFDTIKFRFFLPLYCNRRIRKEFDLELPLDMVIEPSSCWWNDKPADGKGLF